jgi:mono/diheme cytochrome c family protein
MLNRSSHVVSSARNNRTARAMSRAVAIFGACICLAMIGPAQSPAEPAGQDFEEDYGEFTARPEELASIPINNIVKSLRLNKTAMVLGRDVYAKNCASCHGADLKGVPGQHVPDLTDAEWRFSGDDFASGGITKFPSDVEWTVRYGIRSGHENARGAEVSMLAYDPKFRTEEDTKDFGDAEFLNAAEISDVVEFVLQLSRKGRHGKMPAFQDVLKPEEIKAVSIFTFAHAAAPARARGAAAAKAPTGKKRR